MVALSIKSEELILQVSEMLKKLDYLLFHNKQYIALNGMVMFKRWAKDVFDKLIN